MTGLPGDEIGNTLLKASYLKEDSEIEGGFAGVFGLIAQQYFQKHGDQSDGLAAIAAKNHRNGVANPLAQMRTALGYEFCRHVSDKTPVVAGPLTSGRASCRDIGVQARLIAAVDGFFKNNTKRKHTTLMTNN